MPTITVNLPGNSVRNITVSPNTSLLNALQNAGVYIPAICGGRGTCGKCRIKLDSGSLPVTPADDTFFSPDDLHADWRLSCRAFPVDDIALTVPESGESHYSAVVSFEQEASAHGVCLGNNIRIGDKSEIYAVAIDIGTTTLGFALVDMRTGKIASRYSAVNRQREFGGDVISRIQRANDGGLTLLSQSIRKQIAEGIVDLCAQASICAESICKIAIVGNTSMLHLLLELSCQTLGKAPFTPVTLDMVRLNSREIIGNDLSMKIDCEMAILPGISTYVGADITAGLYFTELYTHDVPEAFIDIGTNGEMALIHNKKILCTATAAGPAFEGGNIRCGTGSVPGAISRIRFHDGAFVVNTIDNKPPVGICGSGVVDMVYQGLKHGYIEPNGRFTEKVQDDTIKLAGDIVFCQKDVRELQLGKSAIRSGLDALLHHAGLCYDDIQTLYIAGGFGFNLDMESAAGIGLIPPALLPKVSLIGNSALGGAVRFLLNADGDAVLDRIIKQSEEFSLPTDKYFSQHFIDNINFG
jgi:uncharacterized 2Fe-2S/4Fe-4S cluster protein (DUF4445 family)